MNTLINRYYPYEVKDKNFFYDSETGMIYNSTSVINKTIVLINGGCNEESIFKSLDDEFGKIAIKKGLDVLKELTISYKEDKKDKKHLVRNTIKISQEQWFNGEVLNKLWLYLSSSCNCRCSYCFADRGTFGNSSAMMSVETAKKSIDYFFKYLNTKPGRFTIRYFGGEPLLNKEAFIFATEYINHLAKETGSDVNYILATNGTILDADILETIIKNKVYVNISIDGSERVHNLNRKFVNGEGTYSTIISNLEKFKEYNYKKITARLTLAKQGVKTLKDDVKLLWDLGFDDVAMEIVSTDRGELAVDENITDSLRTQIEEITDIMIESYSQNEHKTLRNISDMVVLIKNRVVKMECSLFNPFSLRCTPEGDIYKCEFSVGQKEYCVGNIDQGIEWGKFSKNIYEPEVKCINCWAKRLCGGTCYLHKNKDVVCNYSKIISENALKYYSFLATLKEVQK